MFIVKETVIQSQPKYLMKDSIIGRYEPNWYAIDIPYNQVIGVYISQNVFLYIFFQISLVKIKVFYKSCVIWIKVLLLRGANETRQLASYSNSTRSKLDSSELNSKC